ncbi:gliding motility-associated C-terminal domain-containing protein [Sphingobacterium sp. LRF_L2]|uniref:rhamnogalacturonan lyase family protein n=1 Tax=Sphingobacterium sp. LRF_L2 TaxID=3369421 RepID=UPI003F631259
MKYYIHKKIRVLKILIIGIALPVIMVLSAFFSTPKQRIVLIGDSTVSGGNSTDPLSAWGWGNVLRDWDEYNTLEVINRAIAGQSSRTFYTEGHLAAVIETVQSGDLFLIQFGHNDAGSINDAVYPKASLKGTGNNTEVVLNSKTNQTETVHTYGWYIRQFVRQAKEKGAIPVVLSPVPRNIFSNGAVVRANEDYGKWAREIASNEGIAFIDLNNLVANKYDQLGASAVTSLFVSGDHTHTNRAGALQNAEEVYEGLNRLGVILGEDILLGSWEDLDGDRQIAGGSIAYSSTIATIKNDKTIVFSAFTLNGKLQVKVRNGQNWDSVSDNFSTNITHPRLWKNDQGDVYISYVDVSNGARLVVQRFDFDKENWQTLGFASGSTAVVNLQNAAARNHALAFDTEHTPYVVYLTANGPIAQRYTNESWTQLGSSIDGVRSSSPDIGIDRSTNMPYVLYIPGTASTGQLTLKSLGNDNQWIPVAIPGTIPSTGAITTGARFSTLTVTRDTLYIAYMDGGSGKASKTTVIASGLSTIGWTVKGVLSDRQSTDVNIASDSLGNVTVGAIDGISNGSGRTVARIWRKNVDQEAFVELNKDDVTVGIDEPSANLSLAIGQDFKPYVSYLKNNVFYNYRYHLQVVIPEAELEEEESIPDEVVTKAKRMEKLDRGLIAIRSDPESIFLSWRLLATDDKGIAFNIYRDNLKINDIPITDATNYVDRTAVDGHYVVKTVIGEEELESSSPVSVWTESHLAINMNIPPNGITPNGETYNYSANDLSVGDLDGDGEYEIVVKWDPSNSGDNLPGQRGSVYIDAYKLNGTQLWRLDLGKNIRSGPHYTQFLVYDFDGDGKAEVALRTSDGTMDGVGNVIGDADADYREESGYILSGPEYLTVFHGPTGKALATVDYIPERGSISSWGDNYGNRVDRFVAAVAYLDGERPSMVFGRGYYTRLVRVAWDFRDGKLTHRWTFDSNDKGNETFAGQGNHQMSVADVDNDGKDEIINGASVINDNGKKLHTTQLGHGDALHVSKMDPSRERQLIWQPQEDPSNYGIYGLNLRDAATGEIIFGVDGEGRDIGRAMAADIDPRYPGYEVWGPVGGLYNIKGELISPRKPSSSNFGIWWDGDLSRELLDDVNIDKWNYNNSTSNRLRSFSSYGAVSNNSTKATPGLSADILGDWREEVIFRSNDSKKLLLFSTTTITAHKLYTLMHDPQYRVAISWQNSGYNQPPHPGYYLGNGMEIEQPHVILEQTAKQDQEIDFQSIDNTAVGSPPIEPIAYSSSSLPVFFKSSDPSIVSVVNNRLIVNEAGEVVITAFQPGNLLWNAAADKVQPLKVEKGIQTITFETVQRTTVGDAATVLSASSTAGLPVTFLSSDVSIASIDDNILTARGRGSVTITALQIGNASWSAANPVAQQVLIDAAPDIVVSKAVSPNGDGVNDILFIEEIQRYPENTISIYDRSGWEIYRATGYDNSGTSFKGLDKRGKSLPEGTYYYVLEWQTEFGKKTIKAWFSLKY